MLLQYYIKRMGHITAYLMDNKSQLRELLSTDIVFYSVIQWVNFKSLKLSIELIFS